MKTWWYVAFIVVGVLLGAGVLMLVTRPPKGHQIVLLPAPTPAPITIYVTGSVNKEGIVSLPPGSRVNDAILAAGGFAGDANQGAINLAGMLQDGQQVNVPAMAPTAIAAGATRSSGGVATQATLGSTILVNINTATLEELDTLPQIGPVTAQKIIDYRTANGPFKTIEGLMDVDGIGQATFDKLKNLVTVGTSP